MAYVVSIELPTVPRGAIVVQRTANLDELEELLVSISYPPEHFAAHFEAYRRRQAALPSTRPATNLSWRSVPIDQPWLINIFTANHTQAVCLLAAELVYLGEHLSRNRIQNKLPANTKFRATLARLVFKQFYARSMLREQFEVLQPTVASPRLRG